MLDFVSIQAELDEAGTDLHKIEGIYARVHAEIEAAPAAGSYQPAGRPTSHLLSNPNTRFANGMQTPLSGNVLSRDPAHRRDEDAMRLEIPSASSSLLGRVLINRDW